MAITIFKGDINTRIELDAKRDISEATLLVITYRKPDGTVGEWEAELSGTDKALYITKENDLDVVGHWEVQLYVEMPSWKGTGTQATFTVYDPIEEYESGEEEIHGNYIAEADVNNWTDAENKQGIIDQVEELIERLTHDVFYSKDLAVTLDGNGKNRIYLKLIPDIISVSEVLHGDTIIDSDYYTYDKNSLYSDPAVYGVLDPEILNGIIFPKGMNNIQITCKIGHTSCPSAIKQAAIILARAENDSTLYTRYSMLESESVEGFSFKRPKKFLSGILEADRLIYPFIRRKIVLGVV